MRILRNKEFHVQFLVGYIAIVVSASALLTGFAAKDDALDARQETIERAEVVREGQIFNCHVIGDPLRHAVIQGLENQSNFAREDIASDKAIPPEFFPNIPPAELDRLLKQGIERNRELIAQNNRIIAGLRDVPPCSERYPPIEK
jgi:hypothetical protein